MDMIRKAAVGGLAVVALAAGAMPVAAQDQRSSGTAAVTRWIAVDTRLTERQLLKEDFVTRDLAGSIRALRLEANRGNVEIARVIVTFADGPPLIDNRFAVLTPRGMPHQLAIDDEGRRIERVTVVATTARRSRGAGRLTLHALQAIAIPVPPLPASATVKPAEARTSASR